MAFHNGYGLCCVIYSIIFYYDYKVYNKPIILIIITLGLRLS